MVSVDCREDNKKKEKKRKGNLQRSAAPSQNEGESFEDVGRGQRTHDGLVDRSVVVLVALLVDDGPVAAGDDQIDGAHGLLVRRLRGL